MNGVVALSVAHSGLDPGVVAASGVTEHEMSRRATDACEAQLASLGVPAVVLRTGRLSQMQSLSRKTTAINGMCPTAAVEIHFNGHPDRLVNYAESIYWEESVQGQLLASTICQALHVGLNGHHNCPTTKPRGDRGLWFLCNTYAPSVIVEAGFLSNVGHAALVASPDGAESIGRLVAEGIANWAKGKLP